MSGIEELNTALDHFRNYLRVSGYTLSVDASLHLRKYMTVAKRRRKIAETLSKREKTPGDLIEGFSRLANESMRFASRENRTTVNVNDVRKAIAVLFCGVWPFCA